MTAPVVAWLCAGVLTANPNLHRCEGWTVDRQGHYLTKFWNPNPARAHARRVMCNKAGAETLEDCAKVLRRKHR